MKGFQDCLEFTLTWEGGYVNHPADPGGATNYGITQAVYTDWQKFRGRPIRPVVGITMDEVEAIYRAEYWNRVSGDLLPEFTNIVMFDWAVNTGPARPARALQKRLGVIQDGRIGPKTIAGFLGHTPYQVAEDLIDARARHYKAIVAARPSQQVFLKGWMNRINALHALILKWHKEKYGKPE